MSYLEPAEFVTKMADQGYADPCLFGWCHVGTRCTVCNHRYGKDRITSNGRNPVPGWLYNALPDETKGAESQAQLSLYHG